MARRAPLAVFTLLLFVHAPGCTPEPVARDAFDGSPIEERTTDEGVVIRVLRAGEGRAAQNGDRVEVHFRLELEDGSAMDESRKGKPLSFLIGSTGDVIDGLHPAVAGMQAGELRTVTIPSKQGYGGRRMGKIPPDSPLVFHLQMVEVHPGSR